jgi:hypothetical protein
VANAKAALRSLPWVDQTSVNIDFRGPHSVGQFHVSDMGRFRQQELLSALQERHVENVVILDIKPGKS